ncbi:MAG: hypothetical protein WBX15_10200 [Thermoanaerobaculia bacterium]
MSKRFVCATMVALALSLSSSLFAATARAISFQQKVAVADQIVLGTCIRTHSAFDPSGRWIVTWSTYRVEKVYKGLPASVVTVVTPGGEVGGLHQVTSGVPSFGEGERNVLFLHGSALGQTVLYQDQGAYRVVSSASGDEMVRPVPSDLMLLDRQTGTIRAAADEPARTLGEFEHAIRSEIRNTPEVQR